MSRIKIPKESPSDMRLPAALGTADDNQKLGVALTQAPTSRVKNTSAGTTYPSSCSSSSHCSTGSCISSAPLSTSSRSSLSSSALAPSIRFTERRPTPASQAHQEHHASSTAGQQRALTSDRTALERPSIPLFTAATGPLTRDAEWDALMAADMDDLVALDLIHWEPEQLAVAISKRAFNSGCHAATGATSTAPPCPPAPPPAGVAGELTEKAAAPLAASDKPGAANLKRSLGERLRGSLGSCFQLRACAS